MVKRWENIERADFLGVGEYDIPTIEPVEFSGNTKFIPFNYAASCKKREDKSIHFFVDDYQFTRLWNDPDRYMPMLREYQYVLTPDFSVQRHYRFTTIIGNTGLEHICRCMELMSSRQSHGVHRIRMNGALTESRRMGQLRYPALEHRKIKLQKSYS